MRAEFFVAGRESVFHAYAWREAAGEVEGAKQAGDFFVLNGCYNT